MASIKINDVGCALLGPLWKQKTGKNTVFP